MNTIPTEMTIQRSPPFNAKAKINYTDKGWKDDAAIISMMGSA
jgi:hypothetical protein